MKIKQLSERNYIFTFFDSPDWNLNLHVIIGAHRNYIVDSGMGSHMLNPMINFIRLRNQKDIFIINTHFHWDHIWANSLREVKEIVAHQTCGALIQANWDKDLTLNQAYIRTPINMQLPTLTFTDEIDFPDDHIKLLFTPGHTSDSICVNDYLEGVLNVGDNIGDTLDQLVPDLDCSVEVYKQSLLKLKNLNASTIVSGHNVVMQPEVFDKIQILLEAH
ncbi:MAG: hypothetical protein BGO41_03520 [Clostridiales bacterium 38-18]|nr:MAG: hypothetical protein BGO41_03520 [Clostridiales bacterium 38-18]